MRGASSGNPLNEFYPFCSLPTDLAVFYSARMSKLFAFIERLVAEGFFGTLTLSFQNGKLANVKVERSLKPTDL